MPIHLEINDGIGSIVLDRPRANALDRAHQELLREIAEAIADDERIRAVLICGAGEYFSAGADIAEMAALPAEEMRAHAPALQASFLSVAAIPQPVVAAIEGFALGGGLELALAADFRICAADAILGLPEIKLGVIPGAGGTQLLTRAIGPARAKLAIMTGEEIKVLDAVRLGLVHQVVPSGTATTEARELAARLAAMPGRALEAAKASIDAAYSPNGFDVETAAFGRLFGTPDQQEGMAAFLEKRAARFQRPTAESEA